MPHVLKSKSILETASCIDAQGTQPNREIMDHAAALATLCPAAGQDAAGARMIGVDAHGFDVQTDGGRLRFDFPSEAATPEDVRRAVISLLSRARAQLG